MKKLYFGLILLSDFMSASQHSATKMNSLVMYQQDVAQLQQKAKSRSLQELRQATDYTYKKREECGKQIAKLNSDSAFMHGQIIGLQSMVSSQNKRYQEEYQRPFDPQRSVHVAQAALTRYEKLSYEQQKQQAENSVLEEVACTPEGIKQYWQRQINGDFSVAQDLFFQSKQQNLEQICYENSQTQEQLQQCYENQSILEQESNKVNSNE